MPVIPTLKESQRLSQGGVGGFQDTSVARSEGQNLMLLGKTVSDVSKSLTEKRKTDKFARSQWIQLAAAQAGSAGNRFMSMNKQPSKKDDGSTLEANYNSYLSDDMAKFSETVPEEFRAEAEMAYQTAKLRGTADVFGEVETRRKTSALYNYGEVTDSIVNDVAINPSKINMREKLQQGIDHVTVATNSGVLSPELYDDNIRGIQKRIVVAQIDGFLKIPESSKEFIEYEKALEALENNKGFFNPEEFEKKADSIKTAKYTGMSRIIRTEKEREEERIKSFKSKQEAEIDSLHQQLMENQNDPIKVRHLKQNIVDRFKSGKYKYAAPSALKVMKEGGELEDSAISFEIQKRLGTKPTMSTINKLRDDVIYMQADDKLSAPEAREWLERLKNLKEQTKKDPNYSTKVRSVMDYIKAAHQVSRLDDLTTLDSNVKRSVLFSIFQANQMLGRGEHPDVVLKKLQVQFGESKVISGVPSNIPYSSKTNRTLDNEAAFDEEEEDIYSLRERGMINNTEYRKRVKETNDLRKAFIAKKSLIEKGADKLFEDIQSGPIAPGTQIPFRR